MPIHPLPLSPSSLRLGENLSACHRCPRRQAACAQGCACLEDGRDILAHARAGECPVGRYSEQRIRGLGDVVARVAKRTGVQRVMGLVERVTGKECGCGRRRENLNRLVPFRDGSIDRVQ